MCSGNEWGAIWSFSLLRKSDDNQRVVIGKELDEFSAFYMAIPQSNGKQVVILIGRIVTMVIIGGLG